MTHTPSRIGHAIAGGAMLAAVGGGVAAVASGEINLEKALANLAPANAQPSNGLAEALNGLEDIGAALGAVAIARRGLTHIRVATNDQQRGLYAEAHVTPSDVSLPRRALAGSSLLVIGAGAMAGNFVDIAHSVSNSQNKVAHLLEGVTGKSEDNYLITNTPSPELADNASISPAVVPSLMIDAPQYSVSLIPSRWEWHAAYLKGENKAKEQLLAASFPEKITDLPPASEDCSDVEVNAAKELGVQVGDSFTMDGLKVTVRHIVDNSSGAELLPVIFNNDDFARCLDGNPNQPFSAILAEGQRQKIAQLLASQGATAHNLSERAFIVPFADFEHNTKLSGENSVNPYVLQALGELLLLSGATLFGRTKSKVVENRRINTAAEANGTSKRMIAKREAEIAESTAVKSGILATPLIFLADAYTNSGIPGGSVAPELKTILFVIGASWAANRAGSAIAMRQEARHINLGKGNAL